MLALLFSRPLGADQYQRPTCNWWLVLSADLADNRLCSRRQEQPTRPSWSDNLVAPQRRGNQHSSAALVRLAVTAPKGTHDTVSLIGQAPCRHPGSRARSGAFLGSLCQFRLCRRRWIKVDMAPTRSRIGQLVMYSSLRADHREMILTTCRRECKVDASARRWRVLVRTDRRWLQLRLASISSGRLLLSIFAQD